MSTYKPLVASMTPGHITQLDDPDGLSVAHLSGVDYIQFDTSYANGTAEGRLQWNIEDGTLEYGLPGGSVNLQVGQEVLVRCRNNSGALLPNGTVVRVTGAQANRPLIDKADAMLPQAANAIGMTTEAIDNNSTGYVTLIGLVRGVDTDLFSEGDLLYLDPATPGALTVTRPLPPNLIIAIGYCIRKHASEGIVACKVAFSPCIECLSGVTLGAPSDGEVLKYTASTTSWDFGDHGDMAGLADDDHSQYHNDTRGDARYYTQTLLDAGQLDTRYFTEAEFINVSAGAGDAGKPIVLDAGGHIAASMLNDADIDHGLLGGLADDDHSQYHNDTRGDVRYYTQTLLDAGQLDTRYFAESEFINVSTGNGDAGKPIVLDVNGRLDASMLDDSDVSHGALSGLANDDHTQYHTDARGDARYYTQVLLDAGQLDNRYFTEAEHINASTGGSDAGKPIVLNVNGQLDSSMIDVTGIDHGSLIGLGDDDHSQYHNNTRGDARYFQQSEFINVSAGGGDAGKPIVLDAAGHIAASMINDADVDHGLLGGLADDDHSQYHNNTRGDARYFQQSEFINVSAGAGDAGKPIVLDAAGLIDSTMVDASGVDHGLLGGLADDDHSQYHNDTRGDARYYTQTLLDAGQLDTRYFAESEFINSSTGAGDAGKPIVLDAGGHVDGTMLDGELIPASTANSQIYQSTGIGTAAWTTDITGLTSLVVDNLTFDGATIDSDTDYVTITDYLRIGTGTGNAMLSMNGTVTATGDVYGQQSRGVVSSTGGTAFGDYNNFTLKPGDGHSANAQWNSMTVDIDAGDVVPWARQFICYGINQTGTGQLQSCAGLEISTQTAGAYNNYAVYCKNDLAVASDTYGLLVGAGKDARIYYDGSDLVLDPQIVGTGDIILKGNTVTEGYVETEGGVGTGPYKRLHVAGLQHNVALETGTMKIRLPHTLDSSRIMYRIEGYNYLAGHRGKWVVEFGGFAYATGWLFIGCSISGDAPFSTVRAAYDGTGACLLLGTETSEWARVEVIVDYATNKMYNASIVPTIDFSADEAVDWTITYEVDCQVYLAPGVELTTDAAGDVTLEVNGIDVVENITIDGSSACKILGQDRTFYVRTTGNDSNNGTTTGTAFLTISRAVNELYTWVADGYAITMDIGEGAFTETSALEPGYAYGGAVTWQGVSEDFASCAISNIDAAETGLTGGLAYIDFDITLPVGKTSAVGQYIVVKTTTGGTLGELCRGAHKVVGWVGGTRVATVRCVRRSGVTFYPTGAVVAATGTVIKTIIDFTGSNGIKLDGAYHGGIWESVAFQGSGASYKGIWMLNGASVGLGENFVSANWDININLQAGGNTFADSTYHSQAGSWIVSVSSGSALSLRYGAICSGGTSGSVRGFNGASIDGRESEHYCYGSSYCILATKGAFIDVESGVAAGYHASVPSAVYVLSGGGIDSTSLSADNPTVRNTPSGTSGAGAYHAY